MVGNRRRIVTVCLCFALCLMPSVFASAALMKQGGTITVAADYGPTGWDPHISTGSSSISHEDLIYESLVMYNQKMEVVPALASSWEQPNPLTLIFHIRKGVKFHNGREMTAEDVKYSLDRIRNPKVSARVDYWTSINTVEVVDKYKVKVTLKNVDISLLPMMAEKKVSAIVPREVVEKNGDLKDVTCGTGPFKVKEYVPGDYTRFVRNPEYWDKGLPRVDEVIFKVIKDESSRLAALRTGVVDIGWFIDPQMGMVAKNIKGLNVVIPPLSRQLKFYLHHSRFPGNNKKLRQAISCAIDRKAIIDALTLGFGTVSSAIPPSYTEYALSEEETWKLPFYKRDLRLAKKLMAEAGYANGFEFEIESSNRSPDWTGSMEMVQAQLREVGIKAVIRQVDWGIQLDNWKKGKFTAMVMAAGWYPTPDLAVGVYWHSQSDTNYFGYSNPEVDKLFDESRKTADMKRRIEIWKKLQYILAEDVFCIFPYASPQMYEVVNARIKDYHFLPTGQRSYLRQAWIDK